MLADAGPLVSLTDRRERDHQRCLAVVATLSGPLVTTWPAFAEAMHLLGPSRLDGGWHLQQALWSWHSRGAVAFHEIGSAETVRAHALMARYRDAPMDLADATLVAAAEALDDWRIFTLDIHFNVYRGAHGQTFEVLP